MDKKIMEYGVCEQEEEEEEQIDNLEEKNSVIYLKDEKCKICLKNAKYRCPKCKIFYCSLPCYNVSV
jgi:hypothetical protein